MTLRRGLVFLFALGATLLFTAAFPTVQASAQTTHMVDDDGQAAAGDCDANTPAFTSPQSAVDAAMSGDTVLVCPGTYGRVGIRDIAITLRSVAGPATTILDGEGASHVVFLSERLGVARSVVEGFTIRHGLGHHQTISLGGGGGILVYYAAPIIRGNVIVNNVACAGSGIYVTGVPFVDPGKPVPVPLIEDNTISNNALNTGTCLINHLGAILGGNSVIRRNVIANNSTDGLGGGITAFGGIIERNIITGNTAASGGGIAAGGATITGNLIAGNHAGAGGGIYWPAGATATPLIVNNTIVDNDSVSGSGMHAGTIDQGGTLINNIVAAAPGQAAVLCGAGTNTLTFQSNNVYSPTGPAYSGGCSVQTGTNGNISIDSLFVDAATGDYHLLAASPNVDAGSNAASGIASIDLDGEPRMFDGNRDHTVVVDIGADEYLPAPFDPARDFSGDGSMDLIFRHALTGDLTIWAMRGVQRVSNVTPSPARVGLNWRLAGTGDFDGDGKPDLLWQEESDGDLVVWFMNGAVRMGFSYLSIQRPADARWRVVSIADMNGDSHPDLVWQHADSGALALWFVDGTTVTSRVGVDPSGPEDTSWKVVSTGDFDGDGKPDLLWKHAGAGYLVVWLMDGQTRLSTVWLTPGQLMDVEWEIAATGDLNGDDKVDIVFQHRDGRLTSWLMDGVVRISGERMFPGAVLDPDWRIAGPR